MRTNDRQHDKNTWTWHAQCFKKTLLVLIWFVRAADRNVIIFTFLTQTDCVNANVERPAWISWVPVWVIEAATIAVSVITKQVVGLLMEQDPAKNVSVVWCAVVAELYTTYDRRRQGSR